MAKNIPRGVWKNIWSAHILHSVGWMFTIHSQNVTLPGCHVFVYFSASFCLNLSSNLYRVLVEKYRYFPTTLVLSGSGCTPRTGKSLMTSCWQLAFLGHWPEQAVKITEASLFDLLETGVPVWCKSPVIFFSKQDFKVDLLSFKPLGFLSHFY